MVGGLTLLLVVAWGGWRFGGTIFPRIEGWIVAGPAPNESASVPSQEIADDALARFNSFRVGSSGDSVFSLTDLELTSIVRHALPGLMPDGVRDATVEVGEDRILLSARVALDAFSEIAAVRDVSAFLPDTVQIEMTSSLLRLDAHHAALVVDGVTAAGMPLPDRLIPDILSALGRTERPGLPSTALALPLPPGIGRAYTAEGALVFESTE
ncbi:MAG: hypothetical protein RQ745_00765 [Longimicrobiales bacterium]|nr:hypothetical protein [Longimicrobiales bacterium]